MAEERSGCDMNSIQKDLDSRKITMQCDGPVVTLYSTPIAGLWLASADDCKRVRAVNESPHGPNMWRFVDSDTLFLIESLPVLSVAEMQSDKWIIFMITEGAKRLKPIRIKFREYRKLDMFFDGESAERIGRPIEL